MTTRVKETTMIRPSADTPRGKLWLSRLDMISRSPDAHTCVLYVYTAGTTPSPTIETIKESLGRALVAFYPMAGRLTINSDGRYEIDCNAEGVLFVEAETTHTVADLGNEFEPNDQLRKALFPPPCDYSKGLSTFPLLLVQFTRFSCGGVCFGFAQHHHVADGTAHVHFINSWARLTRGLEISVMPDHDRAKYLSPRHPPQVKFHHLEYDDPPLPLLAPNHSSGAIEESVERIFKITEEQINGLKQKATSMSQNVLDYKLSTFEVLAGHVWQSVCKARAGLLGDDQDVKLYVPSDGRSRFKNPSIPQSYCGNVLFRPSCRVKAKEIMCAPAWEVARRIHESVHRMKDSEYLRSAIDHVESMSNWKSLVRGPHAVSCPNFFINSWTRIPYDEADFGWGAPAFVRRKEIRHEGQSYLVPTDRRDGSLLLLIRLYTTHMSLFEKYLYQF